MSDAIIISCPTPFCNNHLRIDKDYYTECKPILCGFCGKEMVEVEK